MIDRWVAIGSTHHPFPSLQMVHVIPVVTRNLHPGARGGRVGRRWIFFPPLKFNMVRLKISPVEKEIPIEYHDFEVNHVKLGGGFKYV